jgi:pilus assembly protein Flp/PilA
MTVAAFGTLAHADRTTDRIKERDRMNFIARLRALLRDTSGQDLLEYALLVALIALVCVAVITSTGTNVQSIFQKISTALSTAATSGS